MNLENLTLEEKFIAIGGIRLFLWTLYNMTEPFENEIEIEEFMRGAFLDRLKHTDQDVDVIQETALELYTKLSYLILEEKRNGTN